VKVEEEEEEGVVPIREIYKINKKTKSYYQTSKQITDFSRAHNLDWLWLRLLPLHSHGKTLPPLPSPVDTYNNNPL
jgi:hypothetical protein